MEATDQARRFCDCRVAEAGVQLFGHLALQVAQDLSAFPVDTEVARRQLEAELVESTEQCADEHCVPLSRPPHRMPDADNPLGDPSAAERRLVHPGHRMGTTATRGWIAPLVSSAPMSLRL